MPTYRVTILSEFRCLLALLQSDIGAMEAMIDLNVTALTRLTYAVAPAFVARGGGTIINVSSVVAVAPEVLNGVYGASKAFVLAFSQSLHKELAEKNVRIQVVLLSASAYRGRYRAQPAPRGSQSLCRSHRRRRQGITP